MRESALVSPKGAASSGRGASVVRPRQFAAGRHGDQRRHARQHYFAFLSYSHADQSHAEWLLDAIEQFRVPRKLVGRLTENGAIPRRLRPIFRDRGELAASGDLSEDIETALAGSRFLIVLCSPAAVKSRWANLEIEAFKRFHPEGQILAAIVDGEPFASETKGREKEECFPPALRVRYDQRGRPTGKRAEPIAADLREDRDGREAGLLKIIAGMLGVGLDELVQRETHRRHRRLAILSAASIAGMAVTSGLAFTAIQSRNAAQDERREAESLIGFMLGDLREKLEPIGKLDALAGVGSRVLAYYEKQDKSGLSDEALVQRSRALTLLGEIAHLRGDLDAALRHYSEAKAGTAELLRRDPDNPQRLFDHAQNVFWVGWVARDRGDLPSAESAMREYRRLAEQMIAAQPGVAKWELERQNANANLGIVLLDQRRFPEASTRLNEALQIIERLSEKVPSNVDYQQSQVESLAWLADSRAAEGRFDDAISLRQQHIRLLERLIASSGGDVGFRERAIPSHRGLGQLFQAQGRVGPALAELRTSLEQAQSLVPREPSNSKWLGYAARARIALSELLLIQGQTAEAASQLQDGCSVMDGLLAKDRTFALWRAGVRDCHILRARLALNAGDGAAAVRHAGDAVDVARAVKTSDGASDRFYFAQAQRMLGDSYRRAGDIESARSAWRAGWNALPAGVAERPSEMAERTVLLRRLGRAEEARALSARLSAMGYHNPMFVRDMRT